MTKFSMLDLSPIVEGGDAGLALRNTLDLARHAEALGFSRYWLAEHHNMPGIASAATAVVIAHVAAGTSRIRVGSGGIMLPNHAPLTIAEQFGTLAALHPGRIDLGVGRAPGSDQRTMLALRRDPTSADRFPHDVIELQSYFRPANADQAVRAVPGEGLEVPIWLLGSSLYSAQLAAMLGLPFAFASHFAPDLMEQAVRLYRERFEPSAVRERPYVMLALNVIAAEDDYAAERLFTSAKQQFMMLRRGMPGKLQPPVDSMEGLWTPPEAAGIKRALSASVVGNREIVGRGLDSFIERHQPDELLIASQIYDHAARRRSMTMAAEHLGALQPA
ncbi:LLM class flavin-dependent oxidoreductase [Lichenicoccus sp.]|uniref:LLM class flavin-dependent oxidoreductase n=1 Tax=Lichenicoccus sp. TaxID=2781899 RepID=UPI003D13B75C